MTTAKIKLPELTAGQAGKEQTVNAAFSIIDLSIDRYVLDKDLATPPGSPANGDAYIVATGATGAWAGKVGQIAFWITSVGVWQFSVPVKGWRAYVVDEDANYVYGGASWGATAAGGLANLSETKISSAPNATVPAVVLTPSVTEANADFVLRPKGSGAILWSTPDGAAGGGNKRGTNAIDLQRTRSGAAEIASGANSILLGGLENTASGSYSAVITGRYNVAGGQYSFVGGGTSSVASAEESSVLGGRNCAIAAGATKSGIVAGLLGRINGNAYDSFIGAGRNCIINTSAVRSGIVSGENNTINSTTSFIGAGYGNTVTGGQCGIASGFNNSIPSGSYCFIGAGQGNSASADWSCVLGGQSNDASGAHSSIAGGLGNVASGVYSFAGGAYSTTRGILGADSFASGRFTATGDAQRSDYMLRAATTNATATVATADAGAASATNTVTLPNASAYAVRGTLVARQDTTTDAASWEFTGLIIRGASAAATSIPTAFVITAMGASAGAAAWTFAVTANTTLGGLAITVTGEASKSIKWVAHVRTVEVVG